MKLYLVSRKDSIGYDEYDSVVVAAENEADARMIHPSEYVTHYKDGKWYGTYSNSLIEYEADNSAFSSWVLLSEVLNLHVQYLGEADASIQKGVILASHNAG